MQKFNLKAEMAQSDSYLKMKPSADLLLFCKFAEGFDILKNILTVEKYLLKITLTP